GDDHRLASPGLPGDDVQPRGQLKDSVVDDADTLDPDLLEHDLTLGATQRERPFPRQPAMLRSNLAPGRAVNGEGLGRAGGTGRSLRVTSIRAPGRSSSCGRPSHHMIPWPSASG